MPGTLAVPGYRPKRNGMYATPVVEGNTVVPTVIPPGSITHRARLGRSPCALLAQGDLPNLARRVIEPGGMTGGTTGVPSTTGGAYIPVLFGRDPGTANVPGIRWLD